MNIFEQLQYSYMFFFVKILSFFYENNQKDLGAITQSSIFVHCYVNFGYGIFFLTSPSQNLLPETKINCSTLVEVLVFLLDQ